MLKVLYESRPFGEEFTHRYPHLVTSRSSQLGLSKQVDFARLNSSLQQPAVTSISPIQPRGSYGHPQPVAEEELNVQGNTVIWSRARQITKTFQYETQVVEGAFFASFPADNSCTEEAQDVAAQSGSCAPDHPCIASPRVKASGLNTICIVLKDSLKFHTIDGSSYSIHLSNFIHRIISSDIGLILEHRRSAEDKSIFFCLTHPSKDLVALSFECSTLSEKSEAQELIYATHSPQTMAKCDKLPMLFVTRSKANGTLSIWQYTASPHDDSIDGQYEAPDLILPPRKRKKTRPIPSTLSTDTQSFLASIRSPSARKESFLAASNSFIHDSDSETNISNENKSFSLELLWTESETKVVRPKHKTGAKSGDFSSIPQALIFHDNDGQPMLCILDRGVLKGISITKLLNHNEQGFELSGIQQAIGLFGCTRDNMIDLAVVRYDEPNTLFLWLSHQVSLLPIHQARGSTIAIKDVIGNRFNMITDRKTFCCQVSLKANQLVRDCLLALHLYCDKKITGLHYHWITAFQSNDVHPWHGFVQSLFMVFPRVHIDNAPVANLKLLKCLMQLQQSHQPSSTPTWPLSIVVQLLHGLHLVYMEYELAAFMSTLYVKELGSLIWFIARLLKSDHWMEYYKVHGADIGSEEADFYFVDYEAASVTAPIDLRAWANNALPRASLVPILDPDSPVLQNTQFVPRIKQLHTIYSHLPLTRGAQQYISWIKQIVHAGYDRHSLNLISAPCAILKSLATAIQQLQQDPPLTESIEFYRFIGRYDLVKQIQLANGQISVDDLPAASKSKHHVKRDLAKLWPAINESPAAASSTVAPATIVDSNQHQKHDEFYRFLLHHYAYYPTSLVDNLKTVNTLLDPCHRQELTVPIRPDSTDQRLAIEHQQIIKQVMQRTMALSLGRAILHYGNNRRSVLVDDQQTLVTIEEKMCQSVKFLPLRTIVHLDDKVYRAEYFHWPRFHQGVACALALSMPNKKNTNDGTLYWLFYMDPEELDVYHGGLLFGLGLNGHILPMLHWFKYITQTRCNLVTIGFLLGTCTSYRASKHADLTKILSIHIPTLQPQSITSQQSPWMVCTCLVGMGLLYLGHNDRMMASVMMSEIAQAVQRYNLQQSTSATGDIESACALSAGFALGFIVLGQGDAYENDPSNTLETLCHYMTGEPLHRARAIGQHEFVSCDADTDEAKDGLDQFARGAPDDPPFGQQTHSLDITAPAAIIALALMYMKSENQRVAQRVDFRDTLTRPYLDYVRPDFLLLRVVAKNLILWSSIAPTQDWIDSQLPDFMKESDSQGYLQPWHVQIVEQAKFNIFAGACLSLGLRYAGTQNAQAFNCLLGHLDKFMHLSDIQPTTFQEQITKQTVSVCLDVLATASAMIMAGSGNEALYERLKRLNQRIPFAAPGTSADTSYGSHMAAHMALGLLFCGHGQYTLKNDMQSVASLLCAFYPFYPTQPDDQKYHLQAFRHLWIMALDQRWITTIDQASGEIAKVPIKIICERATQNEPNEKCETTSTRVVSPAIVPDYASIQSISLDSTEYFPLHLNMQNQQRQQQIESSLRETGLLFVQKRH
ncbi:hypothetical protein BC940DRAFT_344469 [Gongronella butleri]|nr:hypothetical protein BC940DRAFT_344469 [Gongronella butleri]